MTQQQHAAFMQQVRASRVRLLARSVLRHLDNAERDVRVAMTYADAMGQAGLLDQLEAIQARILRLREIVACEG